MRNLSKVTDQHDNDCCSYEWQKQQQQWKQRKHPSLQSSSDYDDNRTQYNKIQSKIKTTTNTKTEKLCYKIETVSVRVFVNIRFIDTTDDNRWRYTNG